MFKNYFIYGSGFGLYGYLPALIKLKKKIFILKKYRRVFFKRNDIKKYIKYVNFVSKINYKNIDAVIFAKRPSDQFAYLKNLKSTPFLYLEKPLSANPKKARVIIKMLKKKKLKFNIAYLFFFLSWYKKLLSFKNNKKINITWNFKSKTFTKNNWKRKEHLGGGIVSFYGIHFVSILAFHGYNLVDSKILNKKKVNKEWIAIFKKNKKIISLKININLKEKFLISSGKYCIHNSRSPFDKRSNKQKDNRIKVLQTYLKAKCFLNNRCHTKIIDLWRRIILKTSIVNL